MSLRALVVLLAMVTFAAPAPTRAQEEAQYRRIELVDGSVRYGRILSSDAESLKVEGKSGPMTIPWMDILDLAEISAAEFQEHMKLRFAWLGTTATPADLQPTGEALARGLLDVAERSPALAILEGAALDATLSEEARAALARCDREDATCVQTATAEAELAGYLYGRIDAGPKLHKMTFVRWSLDAPPAEARRC